MLKCVLGCGAGARTAEASSLRIITEKEGRKMMLTQRSRASIPGGHCGVSDVKSFRLSDNNALASATSRPPPALFPSNAERRQSLNRTGGYFHKFAGREIADKRPLERYREETERLLGILEKRLEGRRWIIEDEFTIADISLLGWVRAT
jgi:glutathione S-transferase-like protein